MTASPKSAQAPVSVEKLSYEEALQELEKIVATLETGEQSLEASLKLFARGSELAKYCTNLLNQAELQVQQIVEETLVPFTPYE